jgi:hypothetical protein
MNELLSEEEDNTPPSPEKVNVASQSNLAGEDAIDSEKKKKKKNKLDKQSVKGGSIRGVETMFKSSYTTQLALTTLADNKANMMISINGIILSIVIASSGANISSNPYLLLPVGVLLISSLTAIFFAIQAARPNIYRAPDLSKEDFLEGRANALFFGHFASLSSKDYFKVVKKIMKSRKLTYQLLSQHTHGLGVGLVRKFKLLQWSYTVFITGLGVSIALFIVIYISLNKDFLIKPAKATDQSATPVTRKPVEQKELSLSAKNNEQEAIPVLIKNTEREAVPVVIKNTEQTTQSSMTKASGVMSLPIFNEFKDLDTVHESSGIGQLPDGRFLVINDEKDHPMDLLTLDDQGHFNAEALYPDKQFEKDSIGSGFRKLADLEGMDIDNQGYIYAVTSHAFNSKGEKKPDRKKLLRFKMEGNQIVEPSVITSLEESIARQHPFLAKAIENSNSKSDDGFNIEGLTLNSSQDKLLFGLRSPLVDNKTVIVSLNNPKELFTTANATPQISETVSLLNLDGNGVRSINYFPMLNGYLIMSGPVGKSDNVNFKLWLWCGDSDAVQPVSVTGLSGFEETEGMTPMLWHGQPRIMMITDGVLVGESTAARYIILKYDQLNIKNSCAKH